MPFRSLFCHKKPILLLSCASFCYMKLILLPFCTIFCYKKQILLPFSLHSDTFCPMKLTLMPSCSILWYEKPSLLLSYAPFCYMKPILLPPILFRILFLLPFSALLISKTGAGRVPLCRLNNVF